MYFLLNLSHYVKRYGHLCQILAFYDAHLQNVVISRDPRSKFQFFYFVLILRLILGKLTKFLVEKLSTSEVMRQKPKRGVSPTSAFGVKINNNRIHVSVNIAMAMAQSNEGQDEFLDGMIRSGRIRLARSINLWYIYIDDLIVFNNKKFLNYLKEIYPSQLTVEEADKSDHLADYLDLTFIIDSGGKLLNRLHDKRDD